MSCNEFNAIYDGHNSIFLIIFALAIRKKTLRDIFQRMKQMTYQYSSESLKWICFIEHI